MARTMAVAIVVARLSDGIARMLAIARSPATGRLLIIECSLGDIGGSAATA